MRGHVDLQKDNAPYFKKSVEFFTNIAKRAVASCHVIDIFASSLDQVLSLPPPPITHPRVVFESLHGTTVLYTILLYCTVLYYCTTVLLYYILYYWTVLYYCTTVQLYYCTIYYTTVLYCTTVHILYCMNCYCTV
jgi:hypothetical protein